MLTRRIIAAGAICVVVNVASLSAQTIPAVASTAQVESAVIRPSALRRSIEREAARLAMDPVPFAASSAVQDDDPEGSWVGRHPVLTGALIGATTGAVYGYVMCRGQCEGQPQLYMLFFGGIGAGIGAATGALVHVITR